MSDIELEAAVFRRLLAHLDSRKDVQNIELMNLAGFCRNCLSKWYVAAAEERGSAVEYEAARELVYGMPYGQWREKYQTPEKSRSLVGHRKFLSDVLREKECLEPLKGQLSPHPTVPHVNRRVGRRSDQGCSESPLI